MNDRLHELNVAGVDGDEAFDVAGVVPGAEFKHSKAQNLLRCGLELP